MAMVDYSLPLAVENKLIFGGLLAAVENKLIFDEFI
jgi:hypothetical protein